MPLWPGLLFCVAAESLAKEAKKISKKIKQIKDLQQKQSAGTSV